MASFASVIDIKGPQRMRILRKQQAPTNKQLV